MGTGLRLTCHLSLAEKDPHGLDLSPKPLEQTPGVKPTFVLHTWDEKKRTQEAGLGPPLLWYVLHPQLFVRPHKPGKAMLTKCRRVKLRGMTESWVGPGGPAGQERSTAPCHGLRLRHPSTPNPSASKPHRKMPEPLPLCLSRETCSEAAQETSDKLWLLAV